MKLQILLAADAAPNVHKTLKPRIETIGSHPVSLKSSEDDASASEGGKTK